MSTSNSNYEFDNFSSFLDNWGDKFDKVKNILSYLNTYPETLSTLKLTGIYDPLSIVSEQMDWVRLCSKFEHPLEKDFFKPYWVPIQKDSLDFFIDMSDKSYPIFETHFFFFEPYRWYKKFLSTEINEILLAPEENTDLEILLAKNDEIRWDLVKDLFNERIKLGFQGISIRTLES
jgi:hypothetical protein